MSRSSLVAAVLTFLVVGAFAYWGIWRLIRPPEVVETPASLSGPSVSAVETPADWQKIDTEQGFSFFAPPGTQVLPLKGKDSLIGEIDGPNFVLRYDFGYFSNDLSEAMYNPDYSEETVSIDGRSGLIRRATLTEAEGWPTFVGLYVQQAVFHSAYPGKWAALEIHGTVATQRDRAIVEQMFKTIRFDEQVSKGGK